MAAFQNPEFYKAQAMRLSTYDKPRVIACAEDHSQHIGMPRGCLDDIRAELANLGIRVVIRDEREAGRPLDVTFTGELRPEQMAAAEAMASHDTGVLAATTAFGKTVIAAWLIAERRVNTLVLVHRVVDDLVADYGHVIVDECHHLSAQTFESVVRRAKARFLVGLSATVARKDGHHPIVTMQCGPVR